MNSYLIAVFCFFSIIGVRAQDITDIWMQIKMPNTISYPIINIVEITNDSVFSYEFDELKDKGTIDISRKNILVLNDSLKIDYKFYNENNFELTNYGKNLEENYKVRFSRLTPTIDKNNFVNSLENKIYKMELPYDSVSFKLGRDLSSDDPIIIKNPPIAADSICLERFGKTFFLSFYNSNSRIYAFPIREIKKDSFTIYGIHGIYDEIVIERVQS
ncbi:hypothetical protein L0P88_19185 [Muricauda sp. SCSIO 64092]|uniref:hypothetical protein n=1 Tax=Allomuricauda sp. SCSIO 64092 TaxID=2908842 RepID=UPI001FF0EAC3|nr:hypothetical protein [Muricauda sp. SCSIO 64092]UOY06037.1 hypothetical protein L0P88_19185 [Muricauda sp. SCSIO 64092]